MILFMMFYVYFTEKIQINFASNTMYEKQTVKLVLAAGTW